MVVKTFLISHEYSAVNSFKDLFPNVTGVLLYALLNIYIYVAYIYDRYRLVFYFLLIQFLFCQFV